MMVRKPPGRLIRQRCLLNEVQERVRRAGYGKEMIGFRKKSRRKEGIILKRVPEEEAHMNRDGRLNIINETPGGYLGAGRQEPFSVSDFSKRGDGRNSLKQIPIRFIASNLAPLASESVIRPSSCRQLKYMRNGLSDHV